MNKKTHLTGLMNDSKWARLFACITQQTGQTFARAKILDEEQEYAIALDIYSDALRGYSADYLAGPIKLSTIEYITVPLPAATDHEQLAAAIRRSGQYLFNITADSLIIYGYH